MGEVDSEVLTRLFQHQVLEMMVEQRRLSRDFAQKLRAWHPSGFGVYRGHPIETDVQVPGLYVAACFHSNGFAYNPISGRLLAEYVADGRTSINVDLYSPDRFGEEETRRFLAEPITQGQALEMRPY